MGFLDTNRTGGNPRDYRIRIARVVMATSMLLGSLVVAPGVASADPDEVGDDSSGVPVAPLDSVETASCAVTVTGTATQPTGEPYAGQVMSLRGYAKGERPEDGPLSEIWWAPRAIGSPVGTNDSGEFTFCVSADDLQNPTIEGLQVVGISNARSEPAAGVLGDTASAIIELPDNPTEPLTINLEMRPATVMGHTSGQGVDLAVIDPVTGFPQRAMLTGVTGGGYAIAVTLSSEVSYQLSTFTLVDGQAPRTIRFFQPGQEGVESPVSTSGSPATANLDLVVRQFDGSSLTEGQWADVVVRRTDGVCAPVDGENRLAVGVNGCLPILRNIANGHILAALDDGTYAVRAQVNGAQAVTALFEVSDGIAAPLEGQTALSVSGDQLVVKLAGLGDIWRPIASDGSPVNSLSLWAYRWEGSDFSGLEASAQFIQLSPDRWAWEPPSEGVYRIRMVPMPGVTVAAGTYRYVSVSGEPLVPRKFCSLDLDIREFTCDTDVTKAGSEFLVSYAEPNAVIRVCLSTPADDAPSDDPPCRASGPGANPDQSQFPEINFATAELDGEGRVLRQRDFRGSVLFDDPGHVYVHLAESDGSAGSDQIFSVELRPPLANPDLLSTQMFYVSVSAAVWTLCVPDGEAVCGGTGKSIELTAEGRRDLGRFDLTPAKIIGQVVDPAGQPVSRSWVSARICDDDPDNPGCFEQVTGVLSRVGDGRFALDLPEGDYELHLSPPWGETVTFSPNSIRITVDDNGEVTHVNGTAFAGGQVTLAFLSPNITGQVTALGALRLFASVGVERWNGQRFDYTGQVVQTDRTGLYRLRLGEGRWRLTAWPQGADAGKFSIGQREVVIDAEGRIIEVDATEIAPPIDARELDVAYGVPNLTGIITRSDGTTPVAWAGVGAERWNGERFEHAAWATTSRTGGFALNVTRGDPAQAAFYRLGVQPPQGVTGLSRTLWIVRAPAEGPLCVVASVGASTCEEGLSSPPFSLTMGTPNLLTRVTGSGQPRSAQVQVRRWDEAAFGFDWIDVWGTAGADGAVDLLVGAGDYQIAAEPRAGSGFARGVRYVRVGSDGPDPTLCEFTLESSGSPPTDCDTNLSEGSGLVDGRIEVQLRAANLVGSVTTSVEGQSRVLTGGWVDLFQETGAERRWVGSTGVDRLGTFGFRVDVPAGPVVRYRVFVNPPTWDPTFAPLGLGRTSFVIWGIHDGGGTILCAEDPAEGPNVGACPADKVVSGDTPTQVVVSGGNVVGDVFTPGRGTSDGGDPIGQAQVQVERREGTRYVWTTEWAQSAADGSFALSLPEGTYRVSVRPPRSRIDLSPGAQIITVAADGSFCLGSEACDGSSPGVSIARLPLDLTAPNVSGVLQRAEDDSRPVARAWIGVEELIGTSYRWTALGAQTDVEGRFALNLPAAPAGEARTYRITVEPPFGSTAGEVRFTRTVSVNDAGDVSGDLSLLHYPTANFDVTLTEQPLPGSESGTSAGAPVSGAWVYLERQISAGSAAQYQWADLATTSRANGRVALQIPVPESGVVTYRMTVTPPWDRTGLARFTRMLTVSADVSADGSVGGVISVADEPDPALVRFPAANVRGVIRLDDSTPNQFAWIQVRTDDAVLEGTSTTATGAFALSLPGGDAPMVYTLVAFANSSQALRQPLRLHVTVSAEGAVTGWSRVGEAMTVCGADCVITAQFPELVPNVAITVNQVIEGAPGSEVVAGAFLRLTCTGGACTPGDRVDLISNAEGIATDQIPLGVYSLRVVAVDAGGTVRTFTSPSDGPVTVPESGTLTTTVTVSLPS